MSKRFKILSLSTSLVLCVSLFLVGVFAASSVSLNVSSTISFKSEGVFVMVEGAIKQGSASSQSNISTIKAYSYKPVSTSDNSPDSAQASEFVTNDGVTPASWSNGTDVTFNEENNVIKYEFNFTNYTEESVYVTRNINLTVLGSFFGESNVVESTTGELVLPAYTGTAPTPVTYSVTITLNNFLTSFTGEERQLTAEFVFERGGVRAPVQADSSVILPTGVTYEIYINDDTQAISSSNLNGLKVRTGDQISIKSLPRELDGLNLYVKNGESQTLVGTLDAVTTSVVIPELQENDTILLQPVKAIMAEIRGLPIDFLLINGQPNTNYMDGDTIYVKAGDVLTKDENNPGSTVPVLFYLYNSEDEQIGGGSINKAGEDFYIIPELQEGCYFTYTTLPTP